MTDDTLYICDHSQDPDCPDPTCPLKAPIAFEHPEYGIYEDECEFDADNENDRRVPVGELECHWKDGVLMRPEGFDGLRCTACGKWVSINENYDGRCYDCSDL